MGEVIRRNAAADDIFADLKVTLQRAQSRGGKWKELAEARLQSHLTTLDAILAQREQNQAELAVANAAVAAEDDSADLLIGRVSNELWNALGRPAADPTLAIIFPGGIGYYADGPDDEQPDRMLLLADLVMTVPAARLDPSVRQGAADKIRELAATYRRAVDQARGPRQRAALLDRTRSALARSLQAELSHLKRLYKAEGFSEADIHAVIPDRPLKRAVKNAELSAPAL